MLHEVFPCQYGHRPWQVDRLFLCLSDEPLEITAFARNDDHGHVIEKASRGQALFPVCGGQYAC